VIPTDFKVEQNYPNPFNPSTTIKYALPMEALVTVRIYNMLGQEIKTLVNNNKPAGSYSVMWNGDDNFGNKVSSGAYIYTVKAGEYFTNKKMLLIK
jgi:flagellar hook assembly protein FlgD